MERLLAFGKVDGYVAFFVLGRADADFARRLLDASAPNVLVDFLGDG